MNERKSLRLPRYRYDQNGAYFITICKRLGHTITASSVPDHGTAIRITLEQRQVRE